ncbi:MAG: class I SAM-dependent methyltransferase [Candidatus Limnocylindria bacterium]
MTSTAARARSFDAWAPEYDRYRPGYPDALFDEIAKRLGLPHQPTVADLGAGTGRAALAMAERGWQVTAVEPGEPMLDVLRARASSDGLPVATRQASAEETGLDPASVDLATAAQAFHWFDRPRAVVEMARIVRPRGGIALFWNVRDASRSPLVAEYHQLLEHHFGDGETGRYLQAGWATGRDATRSAFDGVSSFDGLALTEIQHDLTMTADEFVGMAFTASYVRALRSDAQEAFRAQLVELLARHETSGRPLAIPYRVDLWTARRKDR